MLTLAEKDVYAARLVNVRALGFRSYTVYLRSELWQKIKKTVLAEFPWCTACGRTATTLHHNRYDLDDLLGKRTEHLIPICQRCHHDAEFTKRGEKRGPQRATKKIEQRRERTINRRRNPRTTSEHWAFFFDTVVTIRKYLGMQDDVQARELTERLDDALALLQQSRAHKPRHKRHA
jgi:ribosome-binding protein aMBF1 (putative translation factor)